MSSGIYKITNLVNGKIYIGSAASLQKRKNRHFSDLRRNKHGNPHLQASFNKYDEGSFKWEILCICDPEFLIGNEQEFIDSYSKTLGWDNMYNIIRIIAGSHKRSDDSRRKMSEAQKGKTLSPEHRKKIGEASKGKTLSPEHRKKLSLARSKPVEAIYIKTGFATEFSSAAEAERQWKGAHHSSIAACCLGKRKTHAKHFWRYL